MRSRRTTWEDLGNRSGEVAVRFPCPGFRRGQPDSPVEGASNGRIIPLFEVSNSGSSIGPEQRVLKLALDPWTGETFLELCFFFQRSFRIDNEGLFSRIFYLPWWLDQIDYIRYFVEFIFFGRRFWRFQGWKTWNSKWFNDKRNKGISRGNWKPWM